MIRHIVSAGRAAALLWTTGICLGVGACATNPATGDANFVLMTEDHEIQLGRSNDPKIRARFGVYDDAGLQAYVQKVGERVAAKGDRPDLGDGEPDVHPAGKDIADSEQRRVGATIAQ